ncbi:NAD(P)H-binding protein [Pseudoalteromonas sp. Of7M-16]|uniref:SDR family oxidoreductase n=1 Tax=Pseudoalteromonas sp. Of7M-16 TaxID=2917756 RepID=UPI001EF4FB5C|nr:NAD(P)H-binding protein [Pseudoalteromonas sp. Of7M-16]MCG7550652.1 NAD(P)H-binding protein [Pseudoalteromonas sp. Of7M-16]
MQKSITVIGATGNLAQPVIRNLVAKGVQVTAVVRDVQKAKAALPEEVTCVYADVSDLDSLKDALKGAETVYISLNTTSLDPSLPFHTEREGVINIVDAAKENGVKHVMQIVGIDSLHEEFAANGLIYKTNLIRLPGMDYIKKSGINYTFFHCSFFLDSFPVFIQEGQFGIIGDHTYPIYYTNTTDLAINIYNAIGNDKAYNQAFSVQGKEGISFPEAARKFLDVFSPETQIATYPIAAIPEMGFPAEEAEFMEHLLTYFEQLNEQPVSEQTWQILGEPTTTIESFAKSLVS